MMGRSSGYAATPELRRRRMLKPFTLDQLANRAQLSKSYLSKIERGDRRATPQFARRIARALGYRDLESAVAAKIFKIELDLKKGA